MGLAPPPTRRDELSAFLRSRRARLTPADVGLPDDGGRRRTPGLRREELAVLAGVGVSWYTWLEQGRDINVSPQVLDALARALRLDSAERETLYALARAELPLPDGRDAPPDAAAELSALVEALHPNPAYLLGPRTHVIAWNDAARALLGDVWALPAERRSLLWHFFVSIDRPTAEQSATARNTVARFRAEHARHAGEPAYEQLIVELRERSPLFAQWWEEHDVLDTQRGTKTLTHPTYGVLRLHHTWSIPTGAPELRLGVYAPADEQTRAVLLTL